MYLQEILDKKGSQVFLIAPQATLEEAVERLVKHNVGSLLVWQDDSGSTGVCGMISIGDVVKAHHDFLEQENHYMRSYIHGEGGERATF
jgi:CBS domain-containing protein